MQKIQNQILIIFGASGDLTARKLIPAVFNLFKGKLLPENFVVLGVGRKHLGDDGFREKTVFESNFLKKEGISDADIKDFASKLQYQALDTAHEGAFKTLKERLDSIDASEGTSGNYIFYLSTPPSLYGPISKGLASVRLNQENESYTSQTFTNWAI